MTITYQQDGSRAIENVKKTLCTELREFEHLKELRFLYTFRLTDPKYDVDRIPLEAFVRKIPTGERDRYLKDVEICVHEDSWKGMPAHKREQLIYEQLVQIYVELDEGNLEVALDDDGRVKWQLAKPDISIRRYSKVIERYGVSPLDKPQIDKLLSFRKRRDENA